MAQHVKSKYLLFYTLTIMMAGNGLPYGRDCFVSPPANYSFLAMTTVVCFKYWAVIKIACYSILQVL